MPRGVRSRNGCARCRAHRLKCDEIWPACGRCSRLGARCSGPALQVRWSDKHEIFHSSSDPHQPPGTNSKQPSLEVFGPRPSFLQGRLTDESSGVMVPSLDTVPVGDDDGSWIEQALGLTPPELMLLDNDSLPNPISQLPSVSDGGEEWLELDGTNWSIDAISTSELPTPIPGTTPRPQSSSCRDTLLHPNTHLVEPLTYTQQILRPVNDYNTLLVEYYFKDTAPILSLYDSNMNPFRSTVKRLWGSSELIYVTLQSMAAAFLSNIYPQMSAIGAQLRQKAITLFHALGQAAVDERALLALFMIGGTASWFDVNDTGVQYFILMREHLQRMSDSSQLAPTTKGHLFLREFLTCWEMFLSFVVDDDKLCIPQPALVTVGPKNASTSIFPTAYVPHPLTGVACDAHAYLVRVGRLVRSNRRRMLAKGLLTRATLLQLQEELAEAADLEAALDSLQAPSEADVIDTGDDRTPTWHLTTLADVYRRVGLLQLYRNFPDVLVSRMTSESPGSVSNATEPGKISNSDANKWLQTFALQTVHALRQIPAESGTKDFQPFLLVATCSELRLPEAADPMAANPLLGSRVPDPRVCLEATEVYQARGFLMSRLQTLRQSLPGKPIERCIEIVKATWDTMDCKMDNQSEAIYWLDIVMKHKWETFMA